MALPPGRAVRQPVRQSATIGILTNTRGPTELIILGIGLHPLSRHAPVPAHVAMAVQSTAMTGPLPQVVHPEATRGRRTATAAPRVLTGPGPQDGQA